MQTIILFIFTGLLLHSCSMFEKEDNDAEAIELTDYQKMSDKDYSDHLDAFSDFYLNSATNKKVKLTYSSKKYLNELAGNIIENNAIFFTKITSVNVNIVKSEKPFHFSLPDGVIFISTSLLRKYIRSEKLLYCLLVFELIRSEKLIYKKQEIMPTGILSTDRVLSLIRLNTEEKVEIHKWAFYILNRIGLDTDIYLSWIQIQNRNSLDFSMQLGDVSSISREEALFKAFLIKNTNKRGAGLKKYTSSSRRFYKFLNGVI